MNAVPPPVHLSAAQEHDGLWLLVCCSSCSAAWQPMLETAVIRWQRSGRAVLLTAMANTQTNSHSRGCRRTTLGSHGRAAPPHWWVGVVPCLTLDAVLCGLPPVHWLMTSALQSLSAAIIVLCVSCPPCMGIRRSMRYLFPIHRLDGCYADQHGPASADCHQLGGQKPCSCR